MVVNRRVGWIVMMGLLGGCAAQREEPAAPTGPYGGSRLTDIDTVEPKRREARDDLERLAYERGADLEFVDRLVDDKTAVPEFDRDPLAVLPEAAPVAADVNTLPDTDPFADPPPLADKEVTITVSVARSTYRTRTRGEVLAAVQPFIDLIQREVNIRGAPVLHESTEEVYFGLLDGTEQMAIAHVFDYLLIRSWLADDDSVAPVLLATARPANPRSGDADRTFPGTPGTSIEAIVARDADYATFADLRDARLALAARYVNGPGAFITGLLDDLNHPDDAPFFADVNLRRYAKDAVIDVVKGKADLAIVDQGTMGALDRFYGLGHRVRTLEVSPRYNVDVLFTTTNNLETHRTEIELTQRQITTLGKDPEGQEVLFFFDIDEWFNFRPGDIAAPEAAFEDFLSFIDRTPVDLRPLRDPEAPMDRQTYDRFGDE